MQLVAEILLGGAVLVAAYFAIRKHGESLVRKEIAERDLEASTEAKERLDEINNLSDDDLDKRASVWVRE